MPRTGSSGLSYGFESSALFLEIRKRIDRNTATEYTGFFMAAYGKIP